MDKPEELVMVLAEAKVCLLKQCSCFCLNVWDLVFFFLLLQELEVCFLGVLIFGSKVQT